MSDKPAAFQDQEFTLEEGWTYKLMRTGAIWSNKLFFSSLFLLAVWLIVAALDSNVGCADSYRVIEHQNGTQSYTPDEHCSVFLTTTAKYLGAMSVFSFVASIVFGLLGLVVGKQVVRSTRTAEETGAEERTAGQDPQEGPDEPAGGADERAP